MANFIKKQSTELLYKLNQLEDIPDSETLRHAEALCELAETVRQDAQKLREEERLTE